MRADNLQNRAKLKRAIKFCERGCAQTKHMDFAALHYTKIRIVIVIAVWPVISEANAKFMAALLFIR